MIIPRFLNILRTSWSRADHTIVKCADGMSAIDAVHSDSFDLVVSDLAMPGMDGFELVSEIRVLYPDIPIVIITGVGGVDEAVTAIKRGASDFVIKPFQPQEFKVKVEQNLEHYRLKKEIERLKRDRAARGGVSLVGEGPAMKKLRATMKQVAKSKRAGHPLR